MNFQDALKKVLTFEGGYVNDPKDPGGETNYGITKATATLYGYTGSMKDIPMELVSKIYKSGYWDACKCDSLPDEIRYAVFDFAVNSGAKTAVRKLQEVLGVNPDGVIGDVTIAAAKSFTAKDIKLSNVHVTAYILAVLYTLHRNTFQSQLNGSERYGMGWQNRNTSVILEG